MSNLPKKISWGHASLIVLGIVLVLSFFGVVGYSFVTFCIEQPKVVIVFLILGVLFLGLGKIFQLWYNKENKND